MTPSHFVKSGADLEIYYEIQPYICCHAHVARIIWRPNLIEPDRTLSDSA